MIKLASVIKTAVLASMALSMSMNLAHANDSNQTATSSKPKEQYFRHIMFRETPYAPYRGIHQLESIANPNVAHYEFSYDEQGRVKEIRYQIKDNFIRQNQVWDSFIWFAPNVKIQYQENQEIHSYYNAEGKRIEAHGAVYRAVYDLDDSGKRTALSFFNEQGEPSQSEWNVHRYEWRVADGKVFEKRFNLAGEQQPLRPEFKFYEISLEYDSDGKLTFVRNLGLDGTPTNNDSGAGIDRITYDHEGNFIRWQVYDKDGSPVEGNRPMVHLGEHLYDEYGNKVGLRGFDRFGNRIPFSWGSFEHVNKYNRLGNQVEHAMYNQDGSLTSRMSVQYASDNTKIEWLRSMDENYSLVSTPMLGGAAALKYSYGTDGSVERELFNPDLSKFERESHGSSR